MSTVVHSSSYYSGTTVVSFVATVPQGAHIQNTFGIGLDQV